MCAHPKGQPKCADAEMAPAGWRTCVWYGDATARNGTADRRMACGALTATGVRPPLCRAPRRVATAALSRAVVPSAAMLGGCGRGGKADGCRRHDDDTLES